MYIIYAYYISFVHAHVQQCNTAHNNFVIQVSVHGQSMRMHAYYIYECAERENYDNYYNVVYSAHIHT